MDTPQPDLEPIAFLIGTWRGEGRGTYPTIEDFTYAEEISFVAPPGKPFLIYTQKTKRAGDHPEAGKPLHTETGYLRPVGTERVELVLAMPTGVVEVHDGTVSDGDVRLRTTTVGLTPTAKSVTSVERSLHVERNVLTYELLMGAVGQEHQLHLEARLTRVEDP